MNILLANKYFYIKGGAENSFFQTAKLLKDWGHDISYFSMKHNNNFFSEFEQYFVNNINYENTGFIKQISLAAKVLYSLEARKKMDRLIRAHKPDIAHLNNIYHQISPSIIHSLKQFHIPIVMSLRDYKISCASYLMVANKRPCEACQNEKYYNCLLKRCVKNSIIKSFLSTVEMYLHHKFFKIYDLVDIFISPSRFLKSKVEEMGFKGKVVYIPNFINFDEYHPCYTSCNRSICYVGRLSHEKGVDTLIEAVRGINIELKIIGDGALKNKLEDMATVTGISSANSSNVKFLGYMSDEKLKSEIKNSLFLVIPSEWYENNPRSVIEAFALGKPVIGARIGGIPELVKDGVSGYTFEPGNINDLKEKIQYLLSDYANIVNMGKNAREIAANEYNSELYYNRLLQVYDEAIMINKRRRVHK